MNKSVKRLLEGSPTRFFDDIRAKLDEKSSSIVESVASTVADTVFTEGKKADRDVDSVVVDNKNIQSNIQNKKPEKIKKLKGDLAEDVEPLEELSKATLGRYVKQASDSQRVNGEMSVYNRNAKKVYASSAKALSDKAGKDAVENDRKVGNRRKGIRSAVDQLVAKNEEIAPVAEDLGVHTISTSRGGKNAKSFQTLVVNKKRVSKEAQQRKWSDLIKKATPKETEWDKHTKQ